MSTDTPQPTDSDELQKLQAAQAKELLNWLIDSYPQHAEELRKIKESILQAAAFADDEQCKLKRD
jgi:hypothetical protein